MHKKDATPDSRLWDLCEHHLTSQLLEVHNTDQGDFYEQLHSRSTTFALSKRTGVVVLGKDTGAELDELIQVRDYLRSLGYDAELIRDLAEIPMMSSEEKVRLWGLVSRFCVMVDRVPSGHIAEYVILREQRSILAVLRPEGSGSTFMIGDDNLVDTNFIQMFEFESSPLSSLSDVAQWPEQIAAERKDAYDMAYPWRNK